MGDGRQQRLPRLREVFAQCKLQPGQFAFFAQFQPRVTELYDSNFSETTEQLVFLASWRHKGLYMELGCRNPFERDYVSREWFDFGVYRYDRSDVSRANGRMA